MTDVNSVRHFGYLVMRKPRIDVAVERKTKHLTTAELAERWEMSEATLRNWRWQGRGPTSIKFDRSVRYRLRDVIDYEEARESSSTTQRVASVSQVA